jgi:hypothetical protein
VPGRIPSSTGDPETYFKHSIDEALNNKRDSNRLGDHHPNLLAVITFLTPAFRWPYLVKRTSDGGWRPLPLRHHL